MTFRKWLFVSMILLIVGRVASQDTCPTVVQEALLSLDANCELTERNQACYGNIALTATAQGDVPQFEFDTVGDIANLTDISSLDLEPMDTAAGTWGLAMMKVQADIPESIPGQNVTFVLFGDVTIENAAQEGQTPMQAFYLTTGIGDSNCAEAPESGMMVQTPSGVKEVAFNVNGVDVEMGSTVIFQARPGEEMRVKTIEGKARLTINNEIIPVVQGSEYIAPLDDNFKIGEGGSLIPYEEDDVKSLPIVSLDREIEIAEPLTRDQIQEVEQRQRDGELLCSDDEESYLPPCTKPLYDANGREAQVDENGNIILKGDDGEPLFYDRDGRPIEDVDDYYRHYSYWTESSTVKDDFGNIIEVNEDGTVSILDPEGNRFVATNDGVYTYIGINGETYTFDDETTREELVLDEKGRPVLRDERGDIFTGTPEDDSGIILPPTREPASQDPIKDPKTGETAPGDEYNEPTPEAPGRDLPRDPDSDNSDADPVKPDESGQSDPPKEDPGRELPNNPPPNNDQGTGETREDPPKEDPGREIPDSTESKDPVITTDPGREIPNDPPPDEPKTDDSGREIPPPDDSEREG